jgi:hypothetical protein
MANINSPFDKIHFNIETEKKSLQWLQRQVRSLGTITPNKLINSGSNFVNRIVTGEMYFYMYDPKLKDTLPYYDIFPLVLPFRRLQEGFLGVNLHYLPYTVRFRILKQLHEYATNLKMDETTRVRLSWKLISSIANLKPLEFCVKHYINENIRSKMLKVNYNDWVVASQLPVERFQNVNKASVWRENRYR